MCIRDSGEAVYLDDPLDTYQDLSQYPVLKFDQLIDKCIDLVENGMNGINGKGDIRWSTVLYPGQGDSPESVSYTHLFEKWFTYSYTEWSVSSDNQTRGRYIR